MNRPAMPCGLVAKSVFTDSYVLRNKKTKAVIPINETGIAWESDIQYKFKNMPNGTVINGTKYDWPDVQWTSMTNGN